MNLEALSLGSNARRPVTRRELCVACQETVEPDTSGTVASCPTCGERTVVIPLTRYEQRATEADNASTSRGEASPSAPQPSTPQTAVPPSARERRAAVRDRVAQEVLAFIAAIERGDAPADAVGLPPPPGATIFEGMWGLGEGATRGGATSRIAPAKQEAVDRLPRLTVAENSWVLFQTTLRLTGHYEAVVEAIFAPFSPSPPESIFGRVVLADPITGHTCLTNGDDVQESLVVLDRGVCTFASKALRAEAAGAKAAVVVQTFDVWPYVMEDSKGEAKQGAGLGIPVCMVSKHEGEALKKAIREAGSAGRVHAELSVSSAEKDCIVCQELFAVGAELISLPCGHLYHEACLTRWLKLSNTCPYCRRELPSSDENAEKERRRRQAGQGDEAWEQFFG